MSKSAPGAPPSKTLVTIDGFAAAIGVSRSTVKNWRRLNIIQPSVSVGSIVRFDLAECERRLAEFSSKPTKRRRKKVIFEGKDQRTDK